MLFRSALLKLRTSLDPAKLAPLLVEPTQALLLSASAADHALGARLASEFHLVSLEPVLIRVLDSGTAVFKTRSDAQAKETTTATMVPRAMDALRALTTLRSERADLFMKLAENGEPPVREAALAALAASRSADAPARLLTLWPSLTSAERTTAAERLASSKPSAQALLASLRSGAVKRDEVGLPALERMHTLLPGDPQMEELWRAVAAKFRRVLRLSGGNDDYVDAKLTLAGPFTVEAWVKLAPGINNHDGILGAPGSADFNFFGSQFRVYGEIGRAHV